MAANADFLDGLSLDTLFKEKGFTPNDSQRKAIENTDGPLLLTAGPGSGKTRVLLWRCVNLIVFQNVPPEEIFLATFTEKAALQLKQGLQGLLSIASVYTHKPYDIAEMYVGTLHSLCQKLLTDRRFKEHNQRSRRPLILDDLGQFLFVRDHFYELIENADFGYDDIRNAYSEINEWFGTKTSSKTTAVSNCISFFNRMGEEDFSKQEFSANLGDETLQRLFQMTLHYRELLNEDGVDRVDFSTLQQRAFSRICQKENAGFIFKHIIVDEYQDTNTIQQKIYLKLAEGTKNICVVGDDDQALYRFRGATVENLVDFENICKKNIGVSPTRIDLNINYRSRKNIVETYTRFIDLVSWKNPAERNQFFRIQNKNIVANSTDVEQAVVVETGGKDSVAKKVVALVKQLKESGKISDYNQCAFLFPTIKGNNNGEMAPKVQAYADAFDEAGIKYYAPRAKNFLNTEEALITFGLFAKIFKYSPNGEGYGGMKQFNSWTNDALEAADDVVKKDKSLKAFIEETQKSIEHSKQNYKLLFDFCEKNKISMDSDLSVDLLKRFARVPKLEESVQRVLVGRGLLSFVTRRANEGRPLHVMYALSRATAVDWTLLDMFYQLNCFDYFAAKYKVAETGGEDSGLYNFGLITKYIAQYLETENPILSGMSFANDKVRKNFFGSYLYSLFRLNETEYEDSEDPFPKGCVPFLTVHQSKGLEFPVVVLGSVSHKSKDARRLDCVVRGMQEELGCLPSICEPLDLMDQYDTMRMFYVALSRAKNLLVLPQFKGRGQTTYEPFKTLFEKGNYPNIDDLEIDSLPVSEDHSEDMTHVYTYTADYLPYNNCPRNYMVFHKYGFVPSRSQTMFFGSLVHQTVEDLQNFVMEGR